MQKNVLTISWDESLVQAAKVMVEKHVGYLIVVEKAKPGG